MNRIIRKRLHQRKGFTLIEILVAFTVAGIIITGCAGAFIASYRISSKVLFRCRNLQMICTIAEVFSSDMASITVEKELNGKKKNGPVSGDLSKLSFKVSGPYLPFKEFYTNPASVEYEVKEHNELKYITRSIRKTPYSTENTSLCIAGGLKNISFKYKNKGKWINKCGPADNPDAVDISLVFYNKTDKSSLNYNLKYPVPYHNAQNEQ